MRKFLCAVGVMVAVLLVAGVVSSPAGAASRVQLGYIRYNTPGPDLPVRNWRLNGEYVTLHNTSAAAIRMRGWALYDRDGHGFGFGAFTLGPHASVRIHTGHGRATATDRYWNMDYYVWTNTGDRARLRDQYGRLLDQCHWGAGLGWINC
jgi:hypothetical protein